MGVGVMRRPPLQLQQQIFLLFLAFLRTIYGALTVFTFNSEMTNQSTQLPWQGGRAFPDSNLQTRSDDPPPGVALMRLCEPD
ncbi:MAG: hypothetical protein C0507_01325 [Cyanobacteria bacterium PR.3.49]|nr:hypothetical protein [Cyanobacteria bacterium PR.3.49]